jgi:methyl-accepting chemotaxis protein
MKLGPKLLAAPVAAALIGLATGEINAWMMVGQTRSAQADLTDRLQDFKALAGAQDAIGNVHGRAYRAMALASSLDDAKIKAERALLAERLGTARKAVDAISDEDAELKALVAKIGPLIDRYLKQVDSAIDMAGVDPNTGVAAMQQADVSFAELSKDVGAVLERYQQLTTDAAEANTGRAQRNSLLFALLALAGAGFAIGAAWLLQRRLVADLKEAREVAERVAEGRLDAVASSARADELGDLQRALARMTASLGDSVRTVQDSTHSIRTASEEIASGNADLSARTEQAAASLQQTASSMEQLTGNVSSSAEAARQASQLAEGAAGVAQRGGEVVSQVVSTMNDISDSSRKIADIIGVIDGIAFQTNILALNAAVEAARAGEQGRGFAVVAGEVRSLAQRSASAAREIKTLIGASVDRVESGSRLVADAGTTMTEIVASVRRVCDIVAEISAAANEQNSGIGQVNGAVSSLDRMTQQNAALVEQSAAAADSLRAQAERLNAVVRRFSLGTAAHDA